MNIFIYRRFIYKRDTSTHAHGTDPGVALGAFVSTFVITDFPLIFVLCSSQWSDTDDLSDQTYAALDINIYIYAYTYTYTYVSYKVSTCVIAHFLCVFSSLFQPVVRHGRSLRPNLCSFGYKYIYMCIYI